MMFDLGPENPLKDTQAIHQKIQWDQILMYPV